MNWPNPFAQLLILSVMLSVFQTAYVVAGVPSSSLAEILLAYSFPLFTILWVVADARERRGLPCYDFGLLMMAFFPLSLCWYVFWSRGWKGLAILLTLVALMYVPWLCATSAWLVLHAGIR